MLKYLSRLVHHVSVHGNYCRVGSFSDTYHNRTVNLSSQDFLLIFFAFVIGVCPTQAITFLCFLFLINTEKSNTSVNFLLLSVTPLERFSVILTACDNRTRHEGIKTTRPWEPNRYLILSLVCCKNVFVAVFFLYWKKFSSFSFPTWKISPYWGHCNKNLTA